MRLLVLLILGGALRGQDPLDWDARWSQYLEHTYDWKHIAGVTVGTAFEQTFRWNKCVRPPYCFPDEIGGALVRRTARSTAEWGAGALLGEDLRRIPSGVSGIRKRITYALVHAPLARDRDGEWRPAFSRFTGSLAGAVVSDAWRGKPIQLERLGEHMGWSLSTYFEDALWNEFEPDVKRAARRAAQRMGFRKFLN